MAKKRQLTKREKAVISEASMFQKLTVDTPNEPMYVAVKKDIRDRLKYASSETQVPQSRIVNLSLLYYLSKVGY